MGEKPSLPPLPSNRIPLDVNTFPAGAERQAASYGVEKMFLKFATPEFTSDEKTQYALHNYSTITIASKFKRVTIHHDEQFKNALSLLDSGHLWCEPPGLIIINSPYYLFDGVSGRDHGPEGFLSHLICSLAFRVAKCVTSNMAVNFLDVTQLDVKQYTLKERHVLIWGPITEHFSSYDYNKAIQFLYSFRNYTRILVTSTTDLGAILDNMHVSIDAVTHVFNFAATKDELLPPPPVATGKKTKSKTAKPPINIGV